MTDVEDACDRLIVLADGGLVLEAAVATAKATYRTASTDELGGRPAIGTFAGPSGESLALLADPSVGSPASLEEIVLGHLAAARTRSHGAAA